MCGIAGWVDRERDLTGERATLEAMGATLARRGPDASGFWYSRHAAFAHRRLVVVDPAGGGQPMVRRFGEREYVIVYNGELYNTADLRRELESLGYKFTSYSDTEVLLVSYVVWGAKCVDRLNGIFAFAIWDAAAQTLFLARDRLGVKPLFYAERGSALVFGSELKALLANPLIEPVVDEQGLAEVLLVGPARTPGCGVFRGVRDLRAGHCLTWTPMGCVVRRYWQLTSKPHEDDLETTAAKVRDLLQDTVTRQLVADVPVCTLLSGGLDSSAITAFAAEAFRADGAPPLHTFSIDYAGNDENFHANYYQPDADAPWVKRVSETLGTVHHYIFVDTPELVAALKESMRASDMPDMADVCSSLLLFCREVKKLATVGLSGEAADEVFGGYPWFRNTDALDSGTFPWARANGERTRLLSPDLAERIGPHEYLAHRYHSALAEVPRLPGESPADARMRDVFYLNITRFMPTLLDRKDRMSMANGLEVRVPFCDHRLVEYVWNIPWSLKSCDGREKGILRRALRGVLPDDVLYRRKSPYPKTHNPAYTEAVKGWLVDVLAEPDSPLPQLLNMDRLGEIMAGDSDGIGLSWFGQLMGVPQLYAYLAQLDTWLREYHISLR